MIFFLIFTPENYNTNLAAAHGRVLHAHVPGHFFAPHDTPFGAISNVPRPPVTLSVAVLFGTSFEPPPPHYSLKPPVNPATTTVLKLNKTVNPATTKVLKLNKTVNPATTRVLKLNKTVNPATTRVLKLNKTVNPATTRVLKLNKTVNPATTTVLKLNKTSLLWWRDVITLLEHVTNSSWTKSVCVCKLQRCKKTLMNS